MRRGCLRASTMDRRLRKWGSRLSFTSEYFSYMALPVATSAVLLYTYHTQWPQKNWHQPLHTQTHTHTHKNRANLTPQPSSHMPSTTEGPQLSIIPAGSANQNIMNSLLRTTSEEWLCVRPTSENTAMERKTGRFRTQSSKQVAAYTHSWQGISAAIPWGN